MAPEKNHHAQRRWKYTLHYGGFLGYRMNLSQNLLADVDSVIITLPIQYIAIVF